MGGPPSSVSSLGRYRAPLTYDFWAEGAHKACARTRCRMARFEGQPETTHLSGARPCVWGPSEDGMGDWRAGCLTTKLPPCYDRCMFKRVDVKIATWQGWFKRYGMRCIDIQGSMLCFDLLIVYLRYAGQAPTPPGRAPIKSASLTVSPQSFIRTRLKCDA